MIDMKKRESNFRNTVEHDLQKLPNILNKDYPDNKEKLIAVATDIYYLTSQIVYGEQL